ncbi:FadD3 family acyl-CoA ligase [Ferrimonas pelagia]|uniref:3-((3aS,4S,7aS)-7a-methyl-1, 5-dioxo-octahydro-1H- inden-4-yl)propanoate--CoA ligase FadD3 n=1 Tax=Ferrimonas pelagia TaxID=1177826 RepID=A0ABP9EVH7_9GAMM
MSVHNSSVAEAKTIPQMIARAAQAFGDRIAIDDHGKIITYLELDQLRRQAAKATIAAEIQPGDRIAIWAPNVWEWIVASIGAQSAGAALVPLNTRMKGSEAGYVLNASGSKILFSIGDFLGKHYPSMLEGEDLPDLKRIVELRSGDQWQAFLDSGSTISDAELVDREAQVTPGSMSDLLFTSGTTGAPKGVITGHEQNLKVIADWSGVVGLEPGDRYLIVNPFFHSFGYKAGWLAALLRGCTILPHPVFDAKAILDRIVRERIQILPGPPTLYQSILADPDLAQYDLSSLKVAITGAAAIPISMIQQMREILGFERVLTAYGLTEVCGFATICRSDDSAEIIATTSGRAMPGVEVQCVDRDGNEVPRGEAGEVVVRGPNVMQGYLNNPEATADTIDPQGWLHTEDIGVMDAAGNLKITDRLKDMLISGGFNVYPAEIENSLCNYPGVAQAAVIGIADERMGELPKAFLVPKPGAQLDEAEVIAWCRQNMANYKVPRQVALVDSLPMNASGKVLKFELRKLVSQ